jgi:hypothetical protein
MTIAVSFVFMTVNVDAATRSGLHDIDPPPGDGSQCPLRPHKGVAMLYANAGVIMRTSVAAAALIGTLACSEWKPPTEPATPNPRSYSSGVMNALADGVLFNAGCTGKIVGGYLIIEGASWDWDESIYSIKLSVKAEAVAQAIGVGSVVAADVSFRPGHDVPRAWSASGAQGSGTISITSLTATGASGTFSFTAKALTTNSLPAEYRVTNGTFHVTF